MTTTTGTPKQTSYYKLPENTRLVLLDFDKTLTMFHTGGAQFFSKENPLFVYSAELGQDIYFADNNAAGNASELWAAIRHWIVDCQICVAIITMADSMHAESLQLASHATSLLNTHTAVGGSEMVWRWLHSIAYAELMDKIQALEPSAITDEEIEVTIERQNSVLQNPRLMVVAKFCESSKRSHVQGAMNLFHHRRVLDTLTEDQIVYIDDTASLLQDLGQIMPNVRYIHATNGINRSAWANWFT